MKKTRKEAMATRESILDAADRVFCKKGFSDTTLVNIAEEADMTRGAIYWHFKDKHELFKALLIRNITSPREILNGIFKSSKKPLEKLREIVNTVLRIIMEHPDMTAFDELMLFQKDWGEKYQDIYEIYNDITENIKANITRVIEEAIRMGEVSPSIDLNAIQIAIMSLVGGIKSTWVRKHLPDVPDPDRLTDIIIFGIASR